MLSHINVYVFSGPATNSKRPTYQQSASRRPQVRQHNFLTGACVPRPALICILMWLIANTHTHIRAHIFAQTPTYTVLTFPQGTSSCLRGVCQSEDSPHKHLCVYFGFCVILLRELDGEPPSLRWADDKLHLTQKKHVVIEHAHPKLQLLKCCDQDKSTFSTVSCCQVCLRSSIWNLSDLFSSAVSLVSPQIQFIMLVSAGSVHAVPLPIISPSHVNISDLWSCLFIPKHLGKKKCNSAYGGLQVASV